MTKTTNNKQVRYNLAGKALGVHPTIHEAIEYIKTIFPGQAISIVHDRRIFAHTDSFLVRVGSHSTFSLSPAK